MHNLHYRAHFTTIEFSSAAAASRSFSFSLARMILCCSMWAHAISGRRLPFRFIFFFSGLVVVVLSVFCLFLHAICIAKNYHRPRGSAAFATHFCMDDNHYGGDEDDMTFT